MTRNEKIKRIARDILRLKTLETRKRDSLDFHDHAVWSIKEALEAAYDAGFNRGLARSRPLITAADELISSIMAAREHWECAASKPSSGAWALDELEPASTRLLQRVETAKRAIKAHKAPKEGAA